jgi:pilus assembly protein CpaC
VRRGIFPAVVLAAGLLTISHEATFGAADEPGRLQLTTDRSQVIVLPGEPFTKLSVANPNVADVAVLTPTQFLLNGKAPGVTSLIVFYPSRTRAFDVVVVPPAMGGGTARLVSEPHGVVVHRGDRVSEQRFARDQDQTWVELGVIKVEPDGSRK